MIILNIILFTFIFVVAYIISVKLIALRIKSNIFGIEMFKNRKINMLIKKSLRNVFAWIFMSVVAISLISKKGVAESLMYGAIMCGVYWLFKKNKEKIRKREVLEDLLNVCECLRVQLSSHIALKVALRNISEVCKNITFKEELREMQLEYELSKFTLPETTKRIQQRFNYSEMQLFVSAINQQIQGASAVESLDNLVDLLKDQYVLSMEETTKNKVALMSFGVLIIVINLASLGVYPVVIEVIESAKTMLS